MQIKKWLKRNKQVMGLAVLIALVVTLVQFSVKSPTVSLVSLLGGILLLLVIVKKWIWPTMWFFGVVTESIAIFTVIYFIMAMVYLIYVALALQQGWVSAPPIEINNTVFFLGHSSLP